VPAAPRAAALSPARPSRPPLRVTDGMAALDSSPTVQVANVDLGVERQKLLREKLGGVFAAFAKRAKVRKRLVYTVNAEDLPLERVLRMNEGADALFTGFLYDAQHSESFKQSLRVETPEDLLEVDPQLRYPRIAELLRLLEQGQFRHRKLILVGDLHDKIAQFLRSALPVFATVYTDLDRSQVTPPIRIVSIDRLDPDPQAVYAEGRPIPVAALCSLTVADVPFLGVVNMPEEGNRFVLKDATLIDTARKLYAAEGLQASLLREQVAEEKRAFVRGKKVFIVLEPDLDHILAERFQFDRMEQLHRHHSLADALKSLGGGKGRGIVDYFEREGYDLVWEVLGPEERDLVLLAVLDGRLPALLLKEIETVKPLVTHLEDGDLESLFYNLPEPVVDEVLAALQARSYERFLAVVPARIREAVILDFLDHAERVREAWKGLGEAEQKEILASQAPWLHGTIFLLDSAFSKRKFPALKFDFERNYTSTMLAKMGPEQQKAAYSTIVRSMEAGGVPKGLLARALQPEEIERFFVEYVSRNPAEFYNRLNPAVRKQVWLTVGRTYREHIGKSLHALDKIEILQGSKEAAVALVFANATFLEHLRAGTDEELMRKLFLMLKKLNKTESKSALLKQVLTQPEWRAQRVQGVPALLTDPGNGLIYEKLAEHVEELDFRFDALVCTKSDYETLKEQEPLREAIVTLVDDLVDPGLYDLFRRGDLSKEDYDTFSRSVEKEIAELRRHMGAKEAEDPVGVYVLETMQILHQLTNETMAGGPQGSTVERLDERLAIRQRLVDSMREHLHRIDDFLARAAKQVPLLEHKLAQLRQGLAAQQQQAAQAHAQASALAGEYKKLQQAQAKAGEDRKKVALTQKQLSVQFFELIQPLVLEQVRQLGSPLKSLMRMVGLGAGEGERVGADKRVIFKFSDEEIDHILRYRIVFCAKDPVLAQFVATCLRIDGLEDSLFKLATAETLPNKADIDLLFYGPGYSMEDFADSVKQQRLVPFADEDFYRRLLANERLKARTKSVLTQAEARQQALRPKLAAATQALKARQAKHRQYQEALAGLEREQHKLRENLHSQGERRLHFQGELELLESRLAEVDSQFEGLRGRLGELLGADRAQAGEALQAGQEELAARLRDELLALNGELARMMFIKGVKDAGATISQATQDGILGQIEAREVYPYAKRPFKKLLVADDGSNVSQNLKHAFLQAAIPYFKLRDMAVQEISIQRLLALAESHAQTANGGGEGTAAPAGTAAGGKPGASPYPFVAMFSDRPSDDYGALKLSVKKLRTLLPQTYQLLITPFGELGGLQPGAPLFRNLAALRDHCTLVNATLGHVAEPAGMLRLLREKAPLA
jgi:septal ring factor EnvC (AmiA/AmiB activator)